MSLADVRLACRNLRGDLAALDSLLSDAEASPRSLLSAAQMARLQKVLVGFRERLYTLLDECGQGYDPSTACTQGALAGGGGARAGQEQGKPSGQEEG